MLLPNNIRPEYTVYYSAAYVLEAMRKSEALDLVDLYDASKQLVAVAGGGQYALSFSTFVLCIDWLYLLGAITINVKGELEKCF
jgi:hypothetical protein